jgi:hypothetical protein
MLAVVAKYITQKFAEATDFLRDTQSRNAEFLEITTSLISKIFIYDQIFFNPLPKTPTYHIGNIVCNASDVKLNIDLLLEFLMALVYEIHPETFSLSEDCSSIDEIKPYNNGYCDIN